MLGVLNFPKEDILMVNRYLKIYLTPEKSLYWRLPIETTRYHLTPTRTAVTRKTSR